MLLVPNIHKKLPIGKLMESNLSWTWSQYTTDQVNNDAALCVVTGAWHSQAIVHTKSNLSLEFIFIKIVKRAYIQIDQENNDAAMHY